VKFQEFPRIWDTEIKDLADSVSIEISALASAMSTHHLARASGKYFSKNEKIECSAIIFATKELSVLESMS